MQTVTTSVPGLATRLLRPTGRLLALLFLLLSSGVALAQTNQFVPHDDSNQVPQNTTKSGNVLLNDDNPQNLPNTSFTVTAVTLPTHGTVVVNASGSYNYTPTTGYVGADTFTYKICLTSNPTNCSATATVFLNVYDASIVCTLGTGPNLILNPSFARGNIGFGSSYTYVPTPTSVPDLYAEGTYAITGNSNIYHTGFFMTGRNGATDNCMVVNGAASLGIVYSQSVTVQPNTYYFISAYGASANSISPAQLGLVVDGKSTSVVTTLPSTANQYVQFSDVYFSGPGAAGGFQVTFEIRDINKAANGNDFGIDDLYFGSCSTLLQAETKTTTAVPNAPVPAAIQPLSAIITTGGSTGIQVASFTVQTLPATGTLYYNGTAVTAGQVIPVSGPSSLTSGGALTYQPATGCPVGNVTFTYTATNNAGSPSNNTATYTIPVQAYTVVPGTIAADQTICTGSAPAPLTSTADASGGLGSGYDYQWESSPDNLTWTPVTGATNTTYAPGALSATTYYRRRANSGACATNVSNVATITVQPLVVAGTVAADQTICAGATPAPLTSTTAASGGSGTYAYQWEASPNNVTWTPIAGATGATYAPPALTATTYYRRTVAAGVCAPAISNVVTITVQIAVGAGTIGSDQTICAGTAPAGLVSVAAPTGGTGTYTYQWESSPDNLTWTPIPGATAATYAPPVLTATTYYRRQATSGVGTCASAVSNVVTITVQPATLTPGAIAADQTICTGSTPASLTETTAASGSGTFTYQWESSPDNLTWTPIPGATAATYTPPTLTATTYYRRRVVLGSCATVLSNVVTITVQPAVVAGTIAADQTVCSGTAPAPLTSTGGIIGIYTYQWESSPDNITWTPIAGANGATYSPGALTATTYYRLRLSFGVCPSTLSNVVTITVQPAISPGSIAADQTICTGSTPAPLTSTAGASGGTGTYAYQWDSSPDNLTWTPIAGAVGLTYAPGALTATTYYRRRLTSGTCAAATTNVVTITVQPLVVPGTIAADQTICAGATPAPLTSTTAASGGSGTYAYQWEASPNNVTWAPIAGATGATYAPPALTVTTYFRRTVAAGVCAPAISNVVTVQTQALLTPTVQLATPPAQCAGLPFTFTPVVANAGPAPTYQWLVNGTQVATTAAYTSSTLADGDQVQVVVTPAAGVCSTGAATATITINLTPVALPTLTIAAQTALPVCAGTPITFVLGSVTNAGASPQYQWQVNGVNVPGATATTFTSTTLLNGQAVTLVLRTATVCAPVTVTSNAVLAGVTPLVTVSAGPDQEITEGESVTLQGATTGSNPTWTPTQTLTFSGTDLLHPEAAPLVTTTYTLSAGAGACTGQSSVTVTVTPRVRIPSAFSPNGDGVDDTWRITNLDAYQFSRVIVFNRWGNKLFESTNYGPGNEWDGTIKGQPASIGTYYYVITLSNGKHFTGPLTIIY